MKWEEWRLSRAAKRDALRRAGLDAPSRRKTSFNASERRMRQAFGGLRVPAWAEMENREQLDIESQTRECVAWVR